MENIIFYTVVFLFALFWGSFSNVVIFRLHKREKGILGGRSHCQKCNHTLGWADLFPLFSWIFLRGKCRYCKTSISWQYPLVEFSMAVFWVFLLAMNSIGLDQVALYGQAWEMIFWVIFGFFWIVLFVMDLRWMEVSRHITIPMIILLIGGIFLRGTPEIINALIGAAIPLVFFGSQIIISRYIYTAKGEWIGEGDLDFGIIMGLLLGWEITLVALFLSYAMGSIVGIFIMRVKGREAQIAFGPFLLISTIICFFWGQALLDWYIGFLS